MKKQLKPLFFFTLAILFIVQLLNAETPPIVGNWEVIPEFTDEFDSGIDSENWETKDPEWIGRFPSYFEPNNVVVEGGKLKLTCRELESYKEGGLRYATAAYKSKNKVKYGYFEAKVNAKGSGYWNSFWLYDATPYQNTEIDVCEVVASEDYWFCTAHRFKDLPDYEGTEDDHTKAQKIFENVPNLLGQFHVYGLDWRRDSIVWYLDGNVVFSTLNEHWHQPLYVIFDTEVNPSWPSLPGSTEEVYEIEYIRSWKDRKPNELVSVGAPSTVVLGETITFPIEYIADATKTISFAFKQRVSPWNTYETATTTVNAGRGTVNLSINIPSNLELTNDYKYQVTIGDGTWDGKDDYFDVERITVSDGSIETIISSVGAPSSVTQGETIIFPVEYVASAEKTISCTFQGNLDPVKSYVTTTATVSAGSGTVNLTMTIPSDVAIGIDNKFQTTIGDGSWEGQDDNFEVNPVKVVTDITEDKIVSIDAPSSVNQGESITILVDYKATSSRTISTSFQQSVDPWDTYKTATTTVGAGSGTASLTMVIPDDLASGSDYKYQTMIGDGSWDGKLDNLETSPVTVNGGTVVSVDTILSVDAPTSVIQGETITISVDYKASTNRTISTSLQQSVDPWDTYETATATVSSGTGTVNLTMTIPSDLASGSDYKYQTMIGDGSWDGKKDNLETSPVTISNSESASISAENISFGEDVVVNFSGTSGNSKDWIGIYVVGAANEDYSYWFYTSGTTTAGTGISSGSVTFSNIPTGNWECRYLINNGYTVEATGTFSVEESNVTEDKIVSTDAPTSVAQGETITISVDYEASANRTVTVYFKQLLAPWNILETAETTVSAGTGTAILSMTIPNDVALGSDYKYQILIGDGTYEGKTDLLEKNPITVTEEVVSSEDMIISVDAPNSVIQGETITITVDYKASTNRTISSSFQQSIDPWDTYETATAAVSSGTGTVNLTMTIPSDLAIGSDYKYQTMIGDGSWDGKKDNLETSPVTISNSESASISAENISFGEDVVVNFSGTSGNSKDWIGIYVVGAANEDYSYWLYTSGTTTAGTGISSGSVTFSNIPTGNWECRYLINNGYTVEATGTFSVEESNVTEDKIVSTDAPISVAQGETITIYVDYEATASRTVTVYFKQLLAPWNILETAETTVSAGTGTASLSMTIPEDVALGSDYKYQILIGDGTYEGKTDLLEKNPITVIAGTIGSVGYQYLKYTVTESNNFKLLELGWLDGSDSYPSSNLTSNTSQSGVAVSGSFGSYCYRAFDGDITETNGLWVGTDVPKYITVDFGSSKVSPTAIRIQKKSWNYLTGFKCEGSNDEDTWDLLLDKTLSTTSDLTWTDRTYDLSAVKSAESALAFSELNSNQNELSVFPNPATGQFNISFSSKYKGDVSIKILSFDGRIIETYKLNKLDIEFFHQFDITNQASGIYLIKVITGDSQTQQKIIKN